MIDPLLSAQRSERPSAARALPARPAQRTKQRPAHTGKMVTAGLSTSLMLGIVSYLGNAAAHASDVAQAASTVPPATPTAVPAATPATVPAGYPSATTVLGALPTAAQPVPIVINVPGLPAPAVPAVPAATNPQQVPAAVPVPVPPPVAAPQPTVPPVVTTATTSASG